MRRFASKPLDVPADREEITRADLIFYGVDHSGPSYEARIFFDNPRADGDTAHDIERGYAGSFAVFGHGGCYGDEGHCAPDDRFADEFDRRPPHPLTEYIRTVVVTEALKRTSGDQVTVQLVAVPRATKDSAASEDIAPVETVRLVAYQD
jgi:hypothetical protein